MKRMILSAFLSFSILSAAASRSEALIIGAAAESGIVVILGLATIGSAGVVSPSGRGAAIVGLLGLLLSEGGKACELGPARLERDLSEQVRLGIYAAADAERIRGELERLDREHSPEAFQVSVRGKSVSEIRSELMKRLGISELSAEYLMVASGYQVAE